MRIHVVKESGIYQLEDSVTDNRRTYLRSPMQNIGATLSVMRISGMCSHASNFGGTAEAKLFRP